MLPVAEPPLAHPTPPTAALPGGACDAHIHMLAGDDFPLWDKRVEDPAPGGLEDWARRLEAHLDALGFARCLIVHSILYGADNAVTLASLARMGDRARGIGLVTDDATEAELDALASAGVVGVRLNYVHGGVLSWRGAQKLAPALAARGMHVQMLAFSHKHLPEIAEDVRAMPVPVVFDHFCWPDLSLGIEEAGFRTLLSLVADGAALVKLSGAYRVCDAPYDRAAPFLEALVRAAPEQCLWGSDWPHIMLADAKRPDAGVLLNQFLDIVTSTSDRKQILTDTPARLYGFAR